MIAALGVDVGSAAVKVVGVNDGGEMVWSFVEPTDPRISEQVERIISSSRELWSEDEVPVVATGYGRRLVRGATKVITEISCHAKGIHRLMGQGGTLIDIGGQDTKVVKVGDKGEVLDFLMNDKCAAGTGRFLENVSRWLKVDMEEMGRLALESREEVSISSTCVVFAESEVVSLIAQEVEIGAITRGLVRSLVKRVVAMARSLGISSPVMASGGVVRNRAVVAMMEEELGERVLVPSEPQLVGAYGAALSALELL